LKCIIYLNDAEIANQIKSSIGEVMPSAKVDIVENCMECFSRGTAYNYAFINETNEGIPWMDLMFHLAAEGVGVYYVADEIDKELIKNIKEASGLSAVNSQNIKQEIFSMFSDLEDETGSKNPEGEENEEKDSIEIGSSLSSIQDYALLKSKKYPATIISVHGAKGGVGKTIISANIAVKLAQMGLKVIAVDFDIENGNLLNVLQVVTEKDLKDVIKGNFYQTETLFEKHSSGLYLLPSLKMPAESELITAEVAERIVGRLAKAFDVIIIDTGSLEIDPMLVALQVSTRSYFVTTYDMTVIAKTFDLIEDAKIMGIDMNKINLVINRVPKKIPASRSDISIYIHLPMLVEIPQDDEVLIAVNSGCVPVENTKCENFSKGINQIVQDIVSQTSLSEKVTYQSTNNETPKKRGLFNR